MKRLLAALVCGAVFLGACGGDGGDAAEDPKGSLVAALDSLSQAEGSEIVVTLESTPESLNAAASAEGGSGLKEEDAEKILDSSLTMRSRGSTPEDMQFELVANIAGDDDFEMKMVDKVLYLRADVEGIAETFGQDTSQLNAVATQAEAQGMDFIRPAIEGEWIAIEGFEELQKQLTGGAVPTPSVADQQKAIEQLKKAVEENATVTHEGSDDAGDHLSVAVPLRDVYESIIEQAGALGQATGALPPEAEVPDEEITLDVWVDGDQVTQIEFDFLQLRNIEDTEIPEGVDQLALRMTVDEFGDEVEPPEDAVKVDAQQVLGSLFGAFMGGASAGGAPAPAPAQSFDCSQLEGAPPDVLKQFADVCPQLQQ